MEIANRGERPVRLLGMSLPWIYHHAARFELVGSDKFQNRLTVLDPPTAPDVVVDPGTAVSGVVNLAEYLGTDTTSINQAPGTYTVIGIVVALAGDPGGDPGDVSRVELRSDEFTVTIQ
jgi:hypothetical protein